MGLIERRKQVAGFFKRRTTVVLAVDNVHAHRNTFGEELAGFSMYYGEMAPTFPFEFIKLLSWLAIYHPDVSQTVKKIVSLGNTGHELEINAKTDAAAEAAADELNTLARTAFPSHAGADGFINQQFRQIIVKGALCQETVPDMAMNGVEEIYQVPVATIRFRFEDGRYVPYQKYKLEDLKLNEETFTYVPLFTEESNPYGILPFAAALRSVIRQEKQWQGIDDHIAMWSILGLTWMQLDLKPQFNEAEAEFQTRAKKMMQLYYNMFVKNIKKGVAVTGKNVELKHHGVSKSANEMSAIVEATHQQLTSGLNIDPALLGYAYSTTETYATVCYETLLGEIANIQRIIKRGMEHPYNLHLTLRKIPATCSMKFNASPSLKKKEDAETDEIRQRMIIAKKDAGIIGPDDAAWELGYDEAYAETAPGTDGGDQGGAGFSAMSPLPPGGGIGMRRRYIAKFDKDSHKYVIERPVIQLAKKKTTMRE